MNELALAQTQTFHYNAMGEWATWRFILNTIAFYGTQKNSP